MGKEKVEKKRKRTQKQQMSDVAHRNLNFVLDVADERQFYKNTR